MGTKGIATRLETWFATARRDMPWRREVTPYGSYLSEIMLQQTTYAGAIGHYGRFLAAFPTIEALAAAPESAVLKVWEGLGYYARARNLLKAAKRIVADGWPTTVEGWQALPGVGPYTAASLASVLNGVRRSVVDGNVSRVFARHWALSDDFRAQGARERLAMRLDHALDYRQTFTHFQLDLAVERAKTGARFVDPATVPLTTAARKILDQLNKS